MSWRDALNRLPEAVPRSELEAAIGELEAAKARLYARLLRDGDSPPGERLEQSDSGRDRLLKVGEVAERLGVTVRWLYEHADELPFTHPVGRFVRFSERRLERWLAARR